MNQTLIKCADLSHYYASKVALNKVSFEVTAGEPVGLVGPNGAGKTTLLSILCGYLQPTAGTVTLFGYPPGDSKLVGKIAALPQDARLDPTFTIDAQLAFYARLQGFSAQQAKTEALRVLDAVMLHDSEGQKPLALSHGMAKRVAIAQALIGSPQLIMLDEPTAGLDPVNSRNIRSLISELSPQTTFIISSHDLNELDRLCQQVLLLDKGVLSTMQLNEAYAGAGSPQTTAGFITIQLESYPLEPVSAALKQLDGVVAVTQPQKNEFIVEYNPVVNAQMDLQIMTCLAQNQWQYRRISQGKSLEEKLFFE